MKATILATGILICVFQCNAVPTETPAIDDLNLLLNQYQDLDLKALSEIIVTSQNKRVALDTVFSDKFMNEITIDSIKNSSKLSISNEMVNISEEHAPIVVLNVLKQFGNLISSLKIDYDGIDERQRINQQLSESLSKSLLQIELIHCNDSDFADLLGPFEKVETVILRFGDLNENTSRFDQIFPSVRRLDLGEMKYVHPGFVEHHFVHLTHLNFEFGEKDGLATIEKRLRLNPQLRSVSLHQCSWDILILMSQTMRNLESLELNGFNDFSPYEGDDIRFENLKVFRFQKFSALLKEIQRIPLVFGNLEEIVCSKPMHLWFDIIMKNKKLKKVWTGEINKQQLFEIAEELPDLEDFSSGYNTYDSIKKVMRFIEKGKNLKRVAFLQSNFNSREAIAEQLGNEWTIVEKGGRYVFIKN